MLNGIKNFLQLVNDNWTTIIVIIGLLLSIFKKIQSYIHKSDDEKIEIVKTQIAETMLKLVTDAELDYDDWEKAGSIKRSQIIKEIFDNYPILSKVTNQKEVIGYIDYMIDSSLRELKKTIEENKVENQS